MYEDVEKPKDFLSGFKDNLDINVFQCTDELVEFEIGGIDAALANTFRRVLLSEVPSVAIEHVYIKQNTSIMQDEVLSHRLGLVPLKVDPDMLEFVGEDGKTHEMNTLVFNLRVKCTEEDMKKVDLDDPQDSTTAFKTVYSRSLKWVPHGDQKARFKKAAPRVVHPDIVLNKLRPGQEIDMELHAVKGVGADHAKFSPVATAFYRMVPYVRLKGDVKGSDAKELVELCPEVFDLVKGQAKVVRPRNGVMCRERIRHSKFESVVEIGRLRDKFIFSVESVGALPAREIFLRAMKVMASKCRAIKEELDAAESRNDS